MPYINRPYRHRPSFIDYLSRYIDTPEVIPPQAHFAVELSSFPAHFAGTWLGRTPSCRRKDAPGIAQKEAKPDMVNYATGYKQEIGVLEKSEYETLEEVDASHVCWEWRSDMGFTVFVRSGIGVMPPISAMLWVPLSQRKTCCPTPTPHYDWLVSFNTSAVRYRLVDP
ncbi:hypothetical protein OE88DRAFT_1638641 [Heliocybe sulcata]|uniref:Uncharacterized protein n=1 Tax=Heliocybe sulcata TaxID=5364 RepID=A0A5C3MXP4_9AGAM|nr:hypothetical protein OE88DRAFT_1638641 [Heliocybe sulcata]